VTTAGIPTGPSVPDWDPPATYLDRLETLEAAIDPDNAALIENQQTPLTSQAATVNLVGGEDGSGIRLGLAAYEENTGSKATVAVGGYAKGKHVFGGNFVAYTDGADHSALGVEIDFGNLNASPGGISHGLLLKSLGGNVGGQGGENYIQMQAAASSPTVNGIVFHVSGGQTPVTGTLIKLNGAVSCVTGIDLSQGVFSSGNAIALGAGGNIAIASTTGTKIGSSSSLIGFYGAAPVARPSWSNPTGSTSRATYDTATVTLAELAQRVRGIILDMRTVGLFA
jgi:hypothetical protein